MDATQVPVLIVGGGVVGLSASLFLAQQGVRATLVERHPGTSIQPRARGVNGRTMELMRALGLDDALRAASVKLGPGVGIYAGETLVKVLAEEGDGGWLMRRIRRKGLRGQPSRKSPVSPCRCTQDELEPVLLEAARARGVDARFSTELCDLTQDAGGVTAELLDRDTGARRQLRAAYVIAADGARSPLRARLGVGQTGDGVLGHLLNLYFRADLAALVKGREFSLCRVENPHLRGLFASINNTDLWVLHLAIDPAEARPSPERCVELIRHAVGLPDLAVELLGALPWQAAVRIIQGYQHGRVFFAGDAAHVMPPWGGFGANTGIQDAHNLAWKLAMVLDGRADPALLTTYDVERRPVAQAVAAISGSMGDPDGLIAVRRGLAMIWKMREIFPYLTMGYGYGSAAVVLEPGRPPGPGTTVMDGRPGTRAPHVWLERAGARISSLDLAGPGFTLVVGARGDAWPPAAGPRWPLSVVRLGVDVRDPGRRWARALGIGASGASLIRPDGIVAWRARGRAASPEAALHTAMAGVLGHAPGPERKTAPAQRKILA